jgi:hypothetical protein
MSLEVQFLPAREGDAVWVRWGEGHQLLVDMGREETGRAMYQRLSQMDEAHRAFELLVITHVDRDHIGGVLTCVSDPETPLPGLTFADVWFNGWEHLHNRRPALTPSAKAVEAMGPAQGERLTKWLRHQSWNEAFDRAPVVRGAGAATPVTLPDGLTITVLGPPQSRLEALQREWKDEVEIALAKGGLDEVSRGLSSGRGRLESLGSSAPPVLDNQVDLTLAADGHTMDPSKSNGSSIVLLLECAGHRVLLTGDAFGDDVVDGLAVLGKGAPVDVDCIKVPHHGSRNNVSRALVEAVVCPCWVFSSDGTQHKHPDAEAIARILRWGSPEQDRTLAFNVPSRFNRWWKNDDWQEQFHYSPTYGDAVDGFTLIFD